MSDPNRELNLGARVFVMRIITIALLIGVIAFAVMTIIIRAQGGMPPPPATPVLTYMALGFAAIGFLAHLTVPRLVTSSAIKKLAERGFTDPGTFVGVYQSQLIITLALLEGAAFFNLMAYMLEGQWPILIVTGILVLAMVVRFPSEARMQAWIDECSEKVLAGRATG